MLNSYLKQLDPVSLEDLAKKIQEIHQETGDIEFLEENLTTIEINLKYIKRLIDTSLNIIEVAKNDF